MKKILDHGIESISLTLFLLYIHLTDMAVRVDWLLPYLLFRLLRPDPQRSAAAGLRAGLDTGLDALDARLDAALAALESERAVLRAEAARLRNARAGEPAAPSPDTRVRRVLRRTEAGDAQW